jgi:3-hydroxyisobutyrate dehydrogenase-like beta-hydroxyacid dehydrogenase
MTPPLHAAVLGLGPMGAPIARNLVAAGHDVQVWNRTATVAAPFAELGATVIDDLASIDAPVILSVLPDVPQLQELLTPAVLAAWSRVRPLLVVMSTTSPERVRALAESLEPHGIRVADCPMSGGDKGAQEATLSLMVGADPADFIELEPLLRSIGRTIVRFGGPGAGSVAKLANQVVVAGTLTALSEAIVLAERSGIDPADLVPILEGGLAASAVLSLKREKLLTGDYSLGGSAKNQLKDLVYATEVAEASGAHAPMSALLRSIFESLQADGRGDEDHSAVIEHFRARAR